MWGKCREHRAELLIGALLVMITFAAYWQVTGHPFINYDDDVYVTNNPEVKAGLTLHGVAWALTAGRASNWHPLTWVSHMLDYGVYGSNAGWHHVTSLLLHALNALMLFLLLSRMTGYRWRSAFVAALFAVHPLHVESVAWVAERKDVLSGFFWMSTMLAYVWYAERPNLKRYGLVALLFALGLMSKPMLVTLPLVLVLMDYWPLGRFNHRGTERSVYWLVVEKLPLLALSVVSSVITFLVQRGAGSVTTIQSVSFGVRVENALVSYMAYIYKMIWPARLALPYPHPHVSLPWWQVDVACVVLVLLSIVAFRARKSRPYVAVGWLWFVATLIPVIGLVQVGEQAMADRYTYLPYIGLFVALVWGIDAAARSLWKRLPKFVPAAVATLIVAVLGIATWVQAGYWSSSRSLFEHSLDITSNNFIAHHKLAEALLSEGDTEGALYHDRKAVGICPVCVPAQGSLADVLMSEGDTQGALERYKIVVRLRPDDAEAHYNLGLALQKAGKLPEAVRELQAAIRLNPKHAKAQGNLGNAFLLQGKVQEAIERYREVLRLDPGDKTAKRNLDVAEKQKANPKGAVVRLTTDQAETLNREGADLVRQGRADEAMQRFQESLRLDPRNASAHCNMGAALAAQQRMDEAIAEYRQALKIDPKYADAHSNLAAALATQGKLDEAIPHFRRATELKPDHVDAHRNLAIALFYKHEYAAAWKEVHLTEKYGGTPNPAFVNDLSSKMPDPGE